jgi:hypothetical protein
VSDQTDVVPETEDEQQGKAKPKPPPSTPPPMQPNSQIDGHKTGVPPKGHKPK